MYLDVEGLYFLFLALAVAALGASLWPALTAPSRKIAVGVAIVFAVIAAIISVVD